LFFSSSLIAYPFESASHFYSFVCRCARVKNSHSQFDKFNHVKYTKSLSLRNWYTQNHSSFFVSNAPNAHKASSNSRASTRSRAPFRAVTTRHATGFFSTRRTPPPRHYWSRIEAFREAGLRRKSVSTNRRDGGCAHVAGYTVIASFSQREKRGQRATGADGSRARTGPGPARRPAFCCKFRAAQITAAFAMR